MRKHLKKPHSVAFGIVLVGFFSVGFLNFVAFEQTIQGESVRGTGETHASAGEPNTHNGKLLRREETVQSPEPLYAIYMSQCVVGTPSFREELVAFVENTALNAIVIDIKDYSGTISFPTNDERFESASLVQCGARDMRAFIETLHEKNIYVIGRITVFQDPHYSARFPEQAVQSVSRPGEPWEDFKGLAFVDVSSKPYWDYIVTLSEEAYALGFDELNYDYVRYPSDGPMKDAQFVNNDKAEALEHFFKYLHNAVSPLDVVTSADLFGYTTILTDDLGIGQQLERALPYFDYIAPMVYPSHYNKGFAGLNDPNEDPYTVIYTSMTEAVRRALSEKTTVKTLAGTPIIEHQVIPAQVNEQGLLVGTTTTSVATGWYTKPVYDPLKLRPWLQDFDYGKDYTVDDIAAQIQATYDAGLTSWFFWDPANRYENLREYLARESR
jgi:hypothetical protein